MKILVLNSGSSSLKFQLFEIKEKEDVLIKGIADGIGLKDSFILYEIKNKIKRIKKKIKNHREALKDVLDIILAEDIINSFNEIKAIGHRAVHGGEDFKEPVIVNDKVMKKIDELSSLAPLHNPANLIGMKVCKELLSKIKQVAVFDTGFHSSMHEKAFIYGIPYTYYKKYGIRRYGFHGTSHHYVSKKAAEILNKDYKKLKIISCHLGNGSSIAAVMNGKSIDTSMGFTPLEGIVMGTRSGDIDPAIIPFLMKKEKLSVKEIDDMLNKKSGLFGISGISPDVRVLWSSEKKGNKKAGLALDILGYRIAKYIGAYIAAMNGVDAIVFTAGIGENAFYIRERVLKHFEYLGLKINKTRNKNNETIISADNSKIKAMVIPTNEELQIARETFELVK
ncbi:acetate kinase [Candidatus Woesearchaeota archaeon CG1_02_33_12]|nr:MAG: acetate kinase [Candidatus Woesearchaeota archaeon CG1_02_33_12]PIN78851.1 MAG: acetate kinase [Candidatus Woesearchaeota archaeon CG10_big_fil_rev_8_21_14_0_10_33_12]PIU72085.1 MAG: acetate kinase [Candidatus Woesearchaeota archaeon CG06_land_8_20_14_3_00_33_13]